MVNLLELLDREDRACRGMDPELFFQDSPGRLGHVVAQQLCSGCAIKLKCREYALERPHLHGAWGGTTTDDRNLMRRHPDLVA